MKFEFEVRPKQIIVGFVIATIVLLLGVSFVYVYEAGKDSQTKVRYVESEEISPVVVELPVVAEPVTPVIKYEKKGECVTVQQVDENVSVMRCDLV